MSFSNDGTLENSSDGPNQSGRKEKGMSDHGPHNTIAENSAELAQTYQEYEQLIDATHAEDISKVVVSKKEMVIESKGGESAQMQNQIVSKINNDADYRKKLLLRVLPTFDKLN